MGSPAGKGTVQLFLMQKGAVVNQSLDLLSVISGGKPSLTGDAGFGSFLLFADINGDGTPDLLVGAPGLDTGGFIDVGAVYIFILKPEATVERWYMISASQDAGSAPTILPNWLTFQNNLKLGTTISFADADSFFFYLLLIHFFSQCWSGYCIDLAKL